jgi:hypothetical protein
VISRRKTAFIFSSNGPPDLHPLKYAIDDADRMAKALTSPNCGFDVVRPSPGSDPFDLRRQLFTVAESCSPEDLFICYFSGHGVLEKGSLVLLWDDTDINHPISTAIPVSDVLQALQYCKAKGKLLVLDCCHAGAAAGKIGLKNAAGIPVSEVNLHADNHLVLMASGRVEQARELEELRGSFLTVKICDALGDELHYADFDQDGRLSVNDLSRWLERKAGEHNNQFPDRKVPIPYLFGQQKGEFFLTGDETDWKPYEFRCADGSIMVVLPNFVNDNLWGTDRVLCIGKYPVVNKQYRKFADWVNAGGLSSHPSEPIGKSFTGKGWTGPFRPWQDRDFNHPDQPVVCVTYSEARDYCEWANQVHRSSIASGQGPHTPDVDIRLAAPPEWDFAAYGSIYHNRHPRSWLSRTPSIHHMAITPARVDFTGTRSNAWGLSDMFGNVWEWCLRNDRHIPTLAAFDNELIRGVELRGGSFLDDLRHVEPVIHSASLQDGIQTSHCDLGFRIAGDVSIRDLPEDITERLAAQRHADIPLRIDAALRSMGEDDGAGHLMYGDDDDL